MHLQRRVSHDFVCGLGCECASRWALCLQKPATEHKLSSPWGLLNHQVTAIQSLTQVRPAVFAFT